MSVTNVKVVVRSRPLLPHETARNVTDIATVEEAAGVIRIGGKSHDYGAGNVVAGPDRHEDMRGPPASGLGWFLRAAAPPFLAIPPGTS